MIIDLKNVSAEEVISAMEENHFEPIFHDWIDGSQYACAITALTANQYKNTATWDDFLEATDDDTEAVARVLQLDLSHLHAFTNGFDNFHVPYGSEQLREIYHNGRKIRQAVLVHFRLND